MKRLAFKLVVFLLLGAVVNVGVAWGCATWSRAGTSIDSLNSVEMAALWNEHTADKRSDNWEPRVTDVGPRWTGFGATKTEIGDRRYVNGGWIRSGGGIIRGLTITEHGWPTRCVRETSRLDTLTIIYRVSFPPAPPDWGQWFNDRLESIVWPGFLINTLFYAVVLWLLWSAPFAARRLIRRKRGRCVKCGYDLRGAEHELCPECGVTMQGEKR